MRFMKAAMAIAAVCAAMMTMVGIRRSRSMKMASMRKRRGMGMMKSRHR
jgi:hypothetical protein